MPVALPVAIRSPAFSGRPRRAERDSAKAKAARRPPGSVVAPPWPTCRPSIDVVQVSEASLRSLLVSAAVVADGVLAQELPRPYARRTFAKVHALIERERATLVSRRGRRGRDAYARLIARAGEYASAVAAMEQAMSDRDDEGLRRHRQALGAGLTGS